MWEEMDRVMAYVTYDGFVSFWSTGIFRVKASLDLTMFPYDEQTFNITFTTWSHPAELLTITVDPDFGLYKADMYYQENIEWELLDDFL